ncbi:hypothetical protein EYF80_015794 [Liparis tanakae]|uniref:Uncharacterized protein n=1 Tax=Liparis tanakae TaxID=230148 RepID=A0A4Z2IA14_9TELE|nr:hypothetical protein EYF80_015794 [Liparis tanakae]
MVYVLHVLHCPSKLPHRCGPLFHRLTERLMTHLSRTKKALHGLGPPTQPATRAPLALFFATMKRSWMPPSHGLVQSVQAVHGRILQPETQEASQLGGLPRV